MRSGWFLIPLALAVACGGWGSRSPEFRGAPVILISVDTLRADHLPAYGYRGLTTPGLAALQQDSILFESAYSHCPLTLPAHVSMLTGLLPATHGVRNNVGYAFDGGAHPTLARLLKSRQYATGAAVSAFVLRSATGIGDSFDFYDDVFGSSGEGAEALSQIQRSGSETVGRAVRWVQTVKAKPFFLFLHIYEPHFPYQPPEPFRTHLGSTYDGEIAASDAVVGDLVDSLKREGLYDRSIILFVSDHGEGLMDHGEQEHGILLNREVLRIPLLLKLPGSRSGGTRVTDPVGLIDIVPTLAALLNIDPPERLSGRSLLDRSSRKTGSDRVYSETYYPRIHLGWSELRSLVDARYHYIDGPEPELYDLTKDPRELADIFSAEREVARSMKKELGGHPESFLEPGGVDAEVAEKLKALGYLSGAAPAGEALPDPKQQIGAHQAMRAAFQLAREGKSEQAVSAFKSLLKANPRSFDALWELAETLVTLRRFQEAAETYQGAMRASPRLAKTVLVSLGRVNLELGRLDEAEANAQAALEDDPSRARQLMARVALARNDLAGAEREARQVMAASGAKPYGAMLLAEVLVRRSSLPEALAVIEQARPLAPVAGYDFLRADVLARLGRHAEAESAFRDAIRSFPRDAQAYANLAILVSLQRRSRSEVQGILESMVKANPSRDSILLAAKTLQFLGDRDGAAQWQRRASTRAQPPG